jgi:putative hydrolase of the HAD superfamily
MSARGIVFDLDDTLYARRQYLASGFAAVADYVAASWRQDRERVRASLLNAHVSGRAGREFQALCSDCRLPHSLVPTLVTLFRGHTPALSLDATVRAALCELRVQGWRLAILTNGEPAVQRRKVSALALTPLVDAVVYAEEHAAAGKPAPEAFLTAALCLRLPAARCVYVGDDPICDIAGARAVGMKTIHLVGLCQRPASTSEADARLETLERLSVVTSHLLPEHAHAA